MTYALNIVTKPKSGDLYEEVAVNAAPLIIRCDSEERLREIVKTNEKLHQHIIDSLKTTALIENGHLCARAIEEPEKIIYIDFSC